MSSILGRTIKEALIVTGIAAIVGIALNAIRDDGLDLVASPETFSVSTKAEFIRIEDAKRLFDEGKAVFVDARAGEVFATGHIEGAINIRPTDDLTEYRWLAQTDSYIICYASKQTQRQAGVVADRLIDMGTSRVYVLRGGLESWLKAGLPTERTEG